MEKKQNYILITPAKNEASHIEETIHSVIAQTSLPLKWIIVNDGSTDDTGKIVASFLKDHDFISLINVESTIRDFASKVHAFNKGFESVKALDYDFIGNLDADISVTPDYYKLILTEFSKNDKLGIAGGFALEENKGVNQNRSGSTIDYVAGGIQVFRRECYEDVGGYLPMEFGYEDGVSQIYAKMLGWEVKSFPEIQAIHRGKLDYRKLSSLFRFYRQGQSEFAVGYHPLFEIIKFFKRLTEKPFLFGSLFRLSGYLFSMLNPKIKQKMPPDFVKFLRKKHIYRMKFLL